MAKFTIQISPNADPQNAVDVDFEVHRYGNPIVLLSAYAVHYDACSDSVVIHLSDEQGHKLRYYVVSDTTLNKQCMLEIAHSKLTYIIGLFDGVMQ